MYYTIILILILVLFIFSGLFLRDMKDTVKTDNIQDGAVTNAKIADLTLTGDKYKFTEYTDFYSEGFTGTGDKPTMKVYDYGREILTVIDFDLQGLTQYPASGTEERVIGTSGKVSYLAKIDYLRSGIYHDGKITCLEPISPNPQGDNIRVWLSTQQFNQGVDLNSNATTSTRIAGNTEDPDAEIYEAAVSPAFVKYGSVDLNTIAVPSISHENFYIYIGTYTNEYSNTYTAGKFRIIIKGYKF